MKLFLTFLSLFLASYTTIVDGSVLPVSASPGISKRTGSDPFQYRTLKLEFTSGPASYTLDLRADGNTYYTNNPAGVSQIKLIYSYEAPKFDIYLYCNYYSNGAKQITLPRNGDGSQVDVGPPQPIYGVACRPTSSLENGCLPVYATCAWSSQQSGTFLSSCCSGYCAANKCRSTSG